MNIWSRLPQQLERLKFQGHWNAQGNLNLVSMFKMKRCIETMEDKIQGLEAWMDPDFFFFFSLHQSKEWTLLSIYSKHYLQNNLEDPSSEDISFTLPIRFLYLDTGTKIFSAWLNSLNCVYLKSLMLKPSGSLAWFDLTL